jgi:hypothetical protein
MPEEELLAHQTAGLDALAGLVVYPDDYLDELRGDWEVACDRRQAADPT